LIIPTGSEISMSELYEEFEFPDEEAAPGS